MDMDPVKRLFSRTRYIILISNPMSVLNMTLASIILTVAHDRKPVDMRFSAAT